MRIPADLNTRTWLTASEAAAYLNYPGLHAFHAMLWRRRKAGRPIKTYRLNGRLRFKQIDLDAAMTVEQAPHRLRAVTASTRCSSLRRCRNCGSGANCCSQFKPSISETR